MSPCASCGRPSRARQEASRETSARTPCGRADPRVMPGGSAGHLLASRRGVAAGRAERSGILEALLGVLSEAGGWFRSDNLLSNELGFPAIVADLIKRAPSARVYMGVGPEQNFNYIAALRPKMAFIVDIRRGNLRCPADVQGAVRVVRGSGRVRLQAVFQAAASDAERAVHAGADFSGLRCRRARAKS